MGGEWLQIVALACALSLDGFGVGVSFGLSGLRTTGAALAVIGLLSAALFAVSMGAGAALSGVFRVGRGFGGLLLVGLGLYQLTRPWHPELVRRPQRADADHSGHIDAHEAMALGIALGVDSLATGFGATLAGFRWWAVPVVAAGQVAAVALGLVAGIWARRWMHSTHTQRRPVAGALLLVGLGLLRLR